MTNLEKLSAILSAVIVSLGAAIPAHAQMSGIGVGASMQVINTKHPTSGVLVAPDIGETRLGATAASVDLTQSITGIHVYSSMTFSSLATDSAVFDFSIGMNGNGYPGNAFGPYMGGLGPSNTNGGHLIYQNVAPTTWTVSYDYDVYGSNTFGINPINITLGNQGLNLGGSTPTPGHYSGTQTFDLGRFTWNVSVAFNPNVGGGSSFGDINGQYFGTIRFNFGPVAAIPEPETYALMLAGLGLLGVVVRRRKQKSAA